MRDSDLEIASAPIDFLGVNNYSRFIVAAGAGGPENVANPDAQHTDMGWEVYPDGLHDVPPDRIAAPTASSLPGTRTAFTTIRADGSMRRRTAAAFSTNAAISVNSR